MAVCLVPGQGGADEASGFVVADKFGGGTISGGSTVFYLHNMNDCSALGYDIQLAPAVAPVAIEDGKAGAFQVICGELLGGASNASG